MNTAVKWCFVTVALLAVPSAFADEREEAGRSRVVNCDRGDSLNRALSKILSLPGSTLVVRVKGVCRESIVIKKDGLTLEGEHASIDGNGKDAVTIDGAQRVTLTGFTIRNGGNGVVGKGAASFSLHDSVVSGHTAMGVLVTGQSAAVISDSVVEKNGVNGVEANDHSQLRIVGRFVSRANTIFGINVLNGSSITFAKAKVEISDNVLGVQIGIGSSAFIEDAQTVVSTSDNQTIGFTAASTSTLFIFEGALLAENNGLDGVALFSNSSADLDRGASITAKTNGRDGILLEDSSLNIFTMPGLAGPKLTTLANGRHGVSALLGSKVDLSGRGQLNSQSNKTTGVFADNGSVLRISGSTLMNNATDVMLQFGTRAEFATTQLGSISCDRTVLIRGEVTCP